MRAGWKTTEFWVGMIVAVFGAVQPQLWPESPIPTEAFVAVGGWIALRLTEKTLGPVGAGGKRAWQTSEFWVSIGFAIIKTLFPDIDPNLIFGILGWTGLRVGVKVAKDTQIGK